MKKANPSYWEQVYDIVRLIPEGRVSTYGAIADYLALGSARMVGWALKNSRINQDFIPAHRVVNRKGELSGRHMFESPTAMQEYLEAEHVVVEDGVKVKDFDKLFWHPEELDLL